MCVSGRCQGRSQTAAVDGSVGRLCRDGQDLRLRKYISGRSMVVLQPTKLGAPRVSLTLKRGRARRALSLLGDNNSKLNLQLAESLLTISAEEFAKKWNFDPIREVPLRTGRYQWTSTDPGVSRTPEAAAEGVVGAAAHDRSRACSVVSVTDLPPPVSDPSRDTCVMQGAAPAANICATAAGSGGQHLCCLRTCVGAGGTAERHNTAPDASTSERDSQRVGIAQPDSQRVETTPQREENDSQATENGTQDRDDSQAGGARVPEADSGGRAEVEEAGVSGCGGGSGAGGPTAAPHTATREDDPHTATREDDPHTAPRNDSHTTTTLRQTCITEYVRPRRRAATSPREPHLHTHSKKRPASSLQDHLHQPPHKKVLLQLRA